MKRPTDANASERAIGGRRRWLTSGAALATGLLVAPTLRAQAAWPARPVRIIVPFPPGGATDIMGRLVAEKLGARLGQPVVVENKAGAGGILGTDTVAKAAPDGYTFTVGLSTSLLINQFLYSKLPYDAQRDLALVSQLAIAPVTLVVSPSIPVGNAKELFAWIGQNKGKVSYGSWGAGSYAHLAGAYMSKKLDAGMSHVPYKGEAQMLQDLVGGQIAFAYASALGTRPFIEAGKLKIVGVTGEQRMQVLPNVPTLGEQGLGDDAYRVAGWVGMAAPAKTPAEIVDRVAREVNAAFQEEDVRKKVIDMGFVPVAATPAAFRAAYQKDLPVWRELVEVSGARLD
jgi:tripartite-type tricarboxylate transporter receptor subunit TctC